MLTTRRTILAGSAASLALLAACQQQAGGSNLTAVLDQISTDILKQSPETCTALAISEQQAGGRFMDKLSDASKTGLERYKSLLQNAVTALNGLNRDSLPHADQVSVDVVKTAAEDQFNALQWEVGTGATQPYVVSQLTGAYQSIPDFLDSQHAITSKETAEAYVTRLTEFARVLDQETARIGEDQAAGVIPPDFAIDRALQLMTTSSSKQPADTVLVKSLKRRLADVQGVTDAEKTAMVAQAAGIVGDAVLPALRRQMDAMRALRPHATHDGGVWKQPHGDEMYAAALRVYTTTTLTPDEIHQMGLQLCADLTGQMDAILKAQGMTRGTVPERIQALSRRPNQLYPNTDAGRAQCLADLNTQVQNIRAMMPTVCNTLAHADLQIKRVPPDTEAGAPGGYYNGAALDGSRPGSYYINMRDMHELPKFSLPTLTYHEGIPGHHWQISIAQESQGLPFIRRALLGFNAYAEGWALYSEMLADEMGVYQNDQLGRLGYLQSAAFRASRLVVDTGMHAKHWSREQAIDSMFGITGDQRSSITTEIERYCVWPGQACGYMVGKQKIIALREEARAAQGAAFDLKAFHDVVLTNGSTPLTVLESLVRAATAPAR